MQWIAVFVGSGLGAIARWHCQAYWNQSEGWPWGTFIVNLVGSIISGVVLAYSNRLSLEVRLFVLTGILGGLTTLSALSYEVIEFALKGKIIEAVAYAATSILLSCLGCFLGFWLFPRQT